LALPGTIPDEVIVEGNHRDAWIVGGAGNPNCGSAVLNETVRSFGLALSKGWKLLRITVFASWGGGEYGLLGSTEWGEEYIHWLDANAVAYLNVDVGVRGQLLSAPVAPLLNDLLYSVTSEVPSQSDHQRPDGPRRLGWPHIYHGKRQRFHCLPRLRGLRGRPVLGLRVTQRSKDHVYHNHSNFDNFHWMETFGDPGFVYHKTMTQVFALMTAKLADSPVTPFRAKEYADALVSYGKKAEARFHEAFSSLSHKEQDICLLFGEEISIIDTSSVRCQLK
jgi:N-acetylated-alpha-linked acidic dipeptidase